jgi:Zn-dependent alcohol dehydrogenase
MDARHIVEKIKSLTEGGVDFAFEMAGSMAAMHELRPLAVGA